MIPNIHLAWLAITFLIIGMGVAMTDSEYLTTISDMSSSSQSELIVEKFSNPSITFIPYSTLNIFPTTTTTTTTESEIPIQKLNENTNDSNIVKTIPAIVIIKSTKSTLLSPSSSTSTSSSSSSSSSSETVTSVLKASSLVVMKKFSSLYSTPTVPSTSLNNINKKFQLEQKSMKVGDINVTVQIGNHAYLPCNVHRVLNKPVSWIRVRDGHIITVDQTLFIADERFQAIFNEIEQKWSLQVKYSQPHDMGLYECQVSSEPKTSSRVFLNVVVPTTELIGDHNRYVKAGSKVALHCIVRGSLEPPSYIIWYRNNEQIVEGNKLGWKMEIDREIFGNSSDEQNTIGSLIIPFVKKKDSGNYTCTPSNSAPVSVSLHVLNGEYSASAIMSSAIINRGKFPISLLVCFLFTLRFA